MDDEIIRKMNLLNFSKIEVEIIKVLKNYSWLNASEISLKANFHRPNIYEGCSRLVRKGILTYRLTRSAVANSKKFALASEKSIDQYFQGLKKDADEVSKFIREGNLSDVKTMEERMNEILKWLKKTYPRAYKEMLRDLEVS